MISQRLIFGRVARLMQRSPCHLTLFGFLFLLFNLSAFAGQIHRLGFSPTAVSADGLTVVGQASGETEGGSPANVAVRWSRDSGLEALPTLLNGGNFTITVANDISADGGTIVGSNGIFIQATPTRWTASAGIHSLLTTEIAPVGTIGVANAVSSDGALCSRRIK